MHMLKPYHEIKITLNYKQGQTIESAQSDIIFSKMGIKFNFSIPDFTFAHSHILNYLFSGCTFSKLFGTLLSSSLEVLH